MTPIAEIIAKLLSCLGTDSGFATQFHRDADPGLQVEGVGRIALPITAHTAQRLCSVAIPAHHGYKDQIRLDPSIRDTWEIPASCLRFDASRWQTVLDAAPERIQRDLGLPSDARLTAELHNLLVYAPGQFFAPHQDSEKTDGMQGTLVITLPSQFHGGEFIVSHQGRTLRSQSSASRLCMVAFYADCPHEVRRVEEGYRIALTYNLVVQAGVLFERAAVERQTWKHCLAWLQQTQGRFSGR